MICEHQPFTFIYNHYLFCLSKLQLEHTIIDSEILLPLQSILFVHSFIYISFLYGISHEGLVDFNNDTIVVH